MGQSFKDTEGRSWAVYITIGAVKKVREQLAGLDLMEAAGGDLFKDLAADPVRVVDILYVLCQGQHKGVDDTAFGQALAGDVLEKAIEAFFEALVDFFPSRQREILRTILQKMKQLEERAVAIVKNRANSPELEKILDQKLNDEISNKLSELQATPGN